MVKSATVEENIIQRRVSVVDEITNILYSWAKMQQVWNLHL